MHGISAEALYVYPMVVEDVPIIAIIMENFKVVRVLQVLFEFHDSPFSVGIVVNEDSRAIAEINVRSNE
jgi:hypothetical protein